MSSARLWIMRAMWKGLRLMGLGRLSWNSQYAANFWTTDHTGRSPHIIRIVKQYGVSNRIVEFGCGEGSLPRAIQDIEYLDYVGYDISDVAIDRAKAGIHEHGLKSCEFLQGDMAAWKGAEGVGLIVAEECINYLSMGALATFLRACNKSLTRDGRMIVVTHSVRKHAMHAIGCCELLELVNWITIEGRTYLVLRRREAGDSCPA